MINGRMKPLERSNVAHWLPCDDCTYTSLSNVNLYIPMTNFIRKPFFMFNITELFMTSCALWFLTQETIWRFSNWDQSICTFHGEKPQRLTWCWAKATGRAGATYIHVIVYVKVIALCWFSTKIPMWNCFYGNNSKRLVFQLAFRKGGNQWIVNWAGGGSTLYASWDCHDYCCPGRIMCSKWRG